MVHDVYICYDENDKLTADAICHVLEENDIKCWIKPRDMGVGHIVEEITNAIKSSKVIVLVFSDNAKNSGFVNTEIDVGFSNNIPTLVYKIDNSVLDGGLEFFLSNTHWLDAYPTPTSEFENLIKDTSKLIGKTIDEPKITPSDFSNIDSKVNSVKFNVQQDQDEFNTKRYAVFAASPIVLFVLSFFFAIIAGLFGADDETIVLIIVIFWGIAFLLAIVLWPYVLIKLIKHRS